MLLCIVFLCLHKESVIVSRGVLNLLRFRFISDVLLGQSKEKHYLCLVRSKWFVEYLVYSRAPEGRNNEFILIVLTSAPTIETWLILPVVIRLSQRLSHACLSISLYTVKLRMAHYISYSLFDSPSTWITVVILELIHALKP